MQADPFQSFARLIIKQYPDTPQIHESEKHSVYLLTFGADLNIHLIGSQPGYLNLVATFPAPRAWLEVEGLHALLSENIFSLQHPQIVLGLDAAGGKLVISLRQPLAELSDESVLPLFEAFVTQAIDMHSGKILSPSTTSTAPKPGELGKTRLQVKSNPSSPVKEKSRA
ncbi:CesT family type III secretion system chaperone [Pseudomonas syringae]|uniref:CesT family type III secretion system chaperone n=1 Tax=Pseudomonas syringae TaxID=317 RepID=UPI00073718F2|nr:CesT family type III secretion system chaperone [Pseudomonas syringae]KTB93622.1 type III chaperone protein ShcF [Pseudomonas syringae pv. syringae PD2774]MCH5555686.1 CesT family type III secretion system chaperone [Pseudomonas syringae pv. syringae]MCH5576330.1 CesT family type III secretion system chaperone [Pseudomonas syringae pv. syringae]MCH5668453.1 CesT family type III secretion system chaperone [Pseudomonas syringae pv. syringae]MDF5774122.1 CesT family type III secretion system c